MPFHICMAYQPQTELRAQQIVTQATSANITPITSKKEGTFTAVCRTYWEAITAIIKKKYFKNQQKNKTNQKRSNPKWHYRQLRIFHLLKNNFTCCTACGLTALALIWWPCTAISLGDLQRRQQARSLCRTSPSMTAFP